MARVKGGTTSNKRRKNILAMTKGYRFGRSTKKKMAKEAIFHAGKYAFDHRRDKKGDFRRLFTVRINGALDAMGSPVSYSRLIGAMSKKGITVNRKILAEMAQKAPESFSRLVSQVS
jgi:large subunit ribosomal protein L20